MQAIASLLTLGMAAVIVYELVAKGSNAPNAVAHISGDVAGFYSSLMTK